MMLLLHPSLHAAITARLHWSASHELLTQLSIRISVSLEILSALDSGSCADELQMGCFETAHASSADAGACCTAGIENTNSEISIKPWPSLIDVSPTVCVCSFCCYNCSANRQHFATSLQAMSAFRRDLERRSLFGDDS